MVKIHESGLFLEVKKFDFFKLDGRGFGLDGDVAGSEGGAVVELDVVVFADGFAFGDVFKIIAADFDFDVDPLVTVEGRAFGVDDV